MAPREPHISYAYLQIGHSGHGVLYLTTDDSQTLEVALLPHLAKLVQRLIKRHQMFPTPAERWLNAFISAKDFADGRLSERNLYSKRAYVYRTRTLIRRAASTAGVNIRPEDVIVHETGKGYAINPSAGVDFKELM